MISIALSLAALMLIQSSMDFLQTKRLDALRDVKSFDITVEGRRVDEVKALLPGRTTFEYGEGDVILNGSAATARYIGEDYDGGIRTSANGSSGALLSYAMKPLSLSGSVEFSALKKGKSGAMIPSKTTLPVAGLYSTALGSEFDSSVVFLPITAADDETKFFTAVKGAKKGDEKILRENGLDATTWREKEKALSSALALEKAMMNLVLSLLFLIIVVSMRSLALAFVCSREKEFAALRALGMGKLKLMVVSGTSFGIVVLAGIALSLPFGFALEKLFEFISRRTSLIVSLDLSFPWGSYCFFALSVLLLTSFFAFNAERRSLKKGIHEVIYG